MLTFSFHAAPAAAQTDNGNNQSVARERFAKGVAAFADKRFGEAADEFEAAYRAEPAFQVLYNIGQVDVALGRSVEAVDAFERYLKQGAAAIPAERRREVRLEIDKQGARIGTLRIATRPEAVDIRLDGRLIGRTPLPGPVRVNAGRHTVEAILAAHLTQARDVDVVGRSTINVELALEPVATTTTAPAPAPVAAAAAPRAAAPAPSSAARIAVERRTIAEPAARSPAAASGSTVSWQRVAGIILIVGGLATATTGGLLTYGGANQASDARDRLVAARDAVPFSDADWNAATSDYNAGRDRYRRGWIVAGVGAAVVTGGILLIMTAPERSTRTLALGAWLAADTGGGLTMNGAW